MDGGDYNKGQEVENRGRGKTLVKLEGASVPTLNVSAVLKHETLTGMTDEKKLFRARTRKAERERE